MKAAIYARKSTDDSDRSDDNKSVTRQVERAKAYAEARDWSVTAEHVFTDDGISGGEFINRPGFSRLMDAAKRREFVAIIMSEPSRLGRDMIRTSYHLAELLDSGIEIHYYLTGEQERGEDPTQRLVSVIRGYAAEDHRMRSSQRSRDALDRKARKGHNTGGRVYGYRNVWVSPDGTRTPAPPGVEKENRELHTEYEIDEIEADIIRRMFRMRADGHGYRAIAKTLNGDPDYSAPAMRYLDGKMPRAPSKGSGSWDPSSVRSILRNIRYTGVIPFGSVRKAYRGGTKVRIRQAQTHLQPAPHLRIVPDDLWQSAGMHSKAAQTTYLKTTKGERFGRLTRDSRYLFSGMARCGCCEANIVAVPRPSGSGDNRRNVHYYGCSWHNNRGISVCQNNHRVEMSAVDDRVLEAIERMVLTPAHVAYVVERAAHLVIQQQRANPDRPREIAAEIVNLRRETERLVTAIAATDSSASLVTALREREARIESLTRELEGLRADHGPGELDTARLKRLLRERVGQFRDELRADVPAARTALRKLLDGPLVFKPVMVDRRKSFAFEGKTRVGALLDPVYLKMASPRGFEPRSPP